MAPAYSRRAACHATTEYVGPSNTDEWKRGAWHNRQAITTSRQVCAAVDWHIGFLLRHELLIENSAWWLTQTIRKLLVRFPT
ncbi:hypothetical protein BIW11_07392 [Tropilaelaps mercedesae]|uniref:Uncharacterized protein n=1 Tax=Tropilaelaps mercedesae TaxID=418985 RepID=A0A1V9XUH6_9ACAR|nr:hypothetical protein BIW11_07392 [Tropilaelaps mercedesae]